MAAARIEWLVDEGDRTFIEILKRTHPEEFKPKGIDHKIPIGKNVLADLMHYKAAGPYFLHGDSFQSRHNKITRDFASGMRWLGWDSERFSKGAHELRKLAGSNWYTHYGVSTAALWLGHADIKTTYQFYSDLIEHPKAIDL